MYKSGIIWYNVFITIKQFTEVKVMSIETKNMQLRALDRWEFKIDKNGIYITEIDNLKVAWSMEGQCGAYTIDGELGLIKDWDRLDDLMSQTEIY